MKKLVVLLLLMVSTSVFAEWTNVGGNETGDKTVYADYGNIKRKGNKVQMWSLYDLKKVVIIADVRFLSSMRRDEYDCEEETIRRLDSFKYSENMRGGEVVYSQTNIKEEAESIPPDSLSGIFLKIACDKK